MKLIDTSSWIEQLRRGGDKVVRTSVEELLAAGEAGWCPIVRLELWNGARGDTERSVLRQMDTAIIVFEINSDVWDTATELAHSARRKGVTIPSTDLLVAACARHHGVAVEHCDNHFELIESL